MTSFWGDKKVLVTGSEGLIGRPMVRKLEELGGTICLLDSVFGHDITDYGDLLWRVESDEPDIVIHLAAVSGVGTSRDDPLKAYQVNVMGTVNVLEACRQVGVKAVVTASSNHVYGGPHPVTYPDGHVDEHAQFKQLDTYSATKICADYITRAYHHNYELPTATVRNTNCYGPADPHLDHLIPGTIQALLEGKRPVIRSDGQTKKSYLYVDDVVDAYLLIAERLYNDEPPGLAGRGINVADEPIAVKDVVWQIRRLIDLPLSSPDIRGQLTDQHDEWLDSSLIRSMGWTPQYSLEQGLKKTIAGFKERYAERVGSSPR